MGVYDTVLRRLLFRIDPEKAHNLALWFIQRGLVRGRAFHHPSLEQELFGVNFPNPLGLAAGFDKNAVALDHWHKLGFGFVEVGTITNEPQPGNPKPRMFRLPKDRALINRLGFNNQGAGAAAGRLGLSRAKVPIGINLGKSKVTPLDEATKDYAASYRLLHQRGDYFVVNVSSPNTPGLRDLQEKDRLEEIVAALRAIDPSRPLFVKVSPDLPSEGLRDIVEVAHKMELTGLIATNTTLDRAGLSASARLEGGLSGAPLRKRSNDVLGELYQACDKSIILIGVGGIFTGQDIYDKIAAGAHLAQVYTGLVYGGPSMPGKTLEELVKLLDGRALAKVRGSAA